MPKIAPFKGFHRSRSSILLSEMKLKSFTLSAKNPFASTVMVLALGWVLASADAFPNTMTEEGQKAGSNTWITQPHDFDRNQLLTSSSSKSGTSFHFLSPNRFSMHQSYSLNFSSGGGGSSSSGLYLNTLAYQIAAPLTLSMDIGFHAPFYNSYSGMQGRTIWNGSQRPSLVLPRIGLDYKPTEHTSISLQLINGSDALKAYGSPYYGGMGSPFWRGL